jgi:hypothetical protein
MNFKWANVLPRRSPLLYFSGLAGAYSAAGMCSRLREGKAEQSAEPNAAQDALGGCNYCIVNVAGAFAFSILRGEFSMLETQTRHVMDCTILFLK